VSLFEQLTEQQQLNVLRVLIEAEDRPGFKMTLDEVAELMENFGGLDDPAFQVPMGLMGVWPK
jgi:hypothetical protein